MRAFEFLIEYGVKGTSFKHKKYRGGKLPDWYEKAVQLKTDNPHMTAAEIGRKLGKYVKTVLRWLTGIPDSAGRIYNNNPPFTSKDFPNIGGKKYFDGAKPWWYEEAIAMRKQGMSYQAISNKLSTSKKRITKDSVRDWLVKGRGNPDAPFDPKWRVEKIDPALLKLLKELILDPKLSDADIIELIADEEGVETASQVRAMLPKLRQALQPGTSVIDKKTGERQDWVVQ